MKVKLDENVPGAAVEVLRLRGHDVDTVLAESLGGQDDPTVLGVSAQRVARGDERQADAAHVRVGEDLVVLGFLVVAAAPS